MPSSWVAALLIIIGVATTHAFLSIHTDHRFILEKCYVEGNLFKLDVPPPSLESFLHIVEKVEEAIDRPDDVIAMLLKRFSLQDVYVVNGQLKQDSLKLNGYVINRVLKATDSNSFPELPSNVLTDEEICGLFAMLSHSWNGTNHDDAHQSDPAIVRYFPAQKRYLMTTMKSKSESLGSDSTVRASTRATTPQMMMYGPREHEKAIKPREMGVVALHPEVTDEAVDMARVLLGIYYSSVYSNPIVDCGELYERVGNRITQDPIAQTECNVLGLITLGEALYRDTLAESRPNPRLAGDWSREAGCLRHHHLPGYPEGSTMAQIKGALDGYILGSQLKNWNQPLSKHLLSRLLRMYYSLPQLNSPGAPSVCNRDNRDEIGVKLDETEVTSFLKTFIKTQSIADPSRVLEDQEQRVGETVNRFFQNFEDYVGLKLSSQCIANTEVDQTTTPLDVVAVLMTPTHEHVRSIVSTMASKLPLQPHGSSLSLLGVGIKGFKNLTSSSVAACAALRDDSTDTEGSRDRTAVLYDLQAYLHDLHAGYKNSLSRNGTVVVFFDFSDSPQNGNAFETLMKQLRSSHPQAKFLSVGREKKVLESFVRIPADAHILDTDVHNFVLKTLLPAVVSAPAEFQIPTCNSKVPKNAGPLKLKILPSRKQMWELSSEYFHKSTQPQLSFTVTSGSLKVCYGDKCSPHIASIDAYESKTKERQVSFNLTDPCKGYSNPHSCPNMKFVLESSRVAADRGLVGSCFQAPDKNTDCQTPIDVEFHVEFKGMQCGCSGLLCSPLVLGACVLMALLRRY